MNLSILLTLAIGIAWVLCSILAAVVIYRILAPLDKVTAATILVGVVGIAAGPVFFFIFGIGWLLDQLDKVALWKSPSLRNWEKKVREIATELDGARKS